jgi:hypothetical protein
MIKLSGKDEAMVMMYSDAFGWRGLVPARTPQNPGLTSLEPSSPSYVRLTCFCWNSLRRVSLVLTTVSGLSYATFFLGRRTPLVPHWLAFCLGCLYALLVTHIA